MPASLRVLIRLLAGISASHARERTIYWSGLLPVYRPFENRRNPWVGLGKLAVWVKCETFFTRPLFSPYFLTHPDHPDQSVLKGIA
jgi:hypothetical protein